MHYAAYFEYNLSIIKRVLSITIKAFWPFLWYIALGTFIHIRVKIAAAIHFKSKKIETKLDVKSMRTWNDVAALK